MTSEDFTFAGLEATLTNGLTTIISVASVVGLILILVMEISLGWNYFKLLLETVERYVVVGVMCYTSPLAFSLGGSKATRNVFKSWCRMVGSQLLLLVMNVWFLRGFASSVGQFIGPSLQRPRLRMWIRPDSPTHPVVLRLIWPAVLGMQVIPVSVLNLVRQLREAVMHPDSLAQLLILSLV